MFYRVRTGVGRRWFALNTHAIFGTPSVTASAGADGPALVSLVCHRDLAMYLIAVKSFIRFVPVREIIAIDDGSLTPRDRAALRAHLSGLRLVPISGIGSEHCPSGGCWERLLFIAGEVARGYVVQLDADTITLEDPVEVRRAIGEGASFTLGTRMGRTIVSAAEAVKAVQPSSDGRDSGRVHVQVAAERALGRLDGAERRRYVRGNAGFAGYAPGSFHPEDVDLFSRQMSDLIGPARWSEWGSEQFTSNYFVANTSSARILPSPGYGSYKPGPDWSLDGRAFIHFIGPSRFRNGVYAVVARRVIQSLRRGVPPHAIAGHGPPGHGAPDGSRDEWT